METSSTHQITSHRPLLWSALLSLGAISTLGASLAKPVQAETSDFRIYNHSNSAIVRLYVSDSNKDSWEQDILDANPIPANMNVQIAFAESNAHLCYYDIRAEFSDGVIVEDFAINTCTMEGYSFFEE
jgi:hypothetical protein